MGDRSDVRLPLRPGGRSASLAGQYYWKPCACTRGTLSRLGRRWASSCRTDGRGSRCQHGSRVRLACGLEESMARARLKRQAREAWPVGVYTQSPPPVQFGASPLRGPCTWSGPSGQSGASGAMNSPTLRTATRRGPMRAEASGGAGMRPLQHTWCLSFGRSAASSAIGGLTPRMETQPREASTKARTRTNVRRARRRSKNKAAVRRCPHSRPH